jgi:Zn2+/Cd2+-exporting ATPase
MKVKLPKDDRLMTAQRWADVGRIIIVGVIAFLYWRGLLDLPVLFAAVVVGIYPLLKTGVLDLVRERKIGTEIFVCIATGIAWASHEYLAATVLMTIILIAEFIAEFNTDRARASINALIGSVPRTATLRSNGNETSVSINELKAGDVVLVRAGEKIPVDGSVIAGNASVNEAPITGESIPVEKSGGATVLAGTLVESGALDIRTERVGQDTMFAHIISLVENAEAQKAPVQKLADKVAAWLIPVVFLFLLTVYLWTHDARKIVTLLIFTSPAELGLATPLVMIASIARAARNGVLVKGGVALELLAKADVFVFDKTGTLTAGKPEVVAIQVVDTQLAETEVVQLAAAADRRSSHPLALAVIDFATRQGLSIPEPSEFETIQGRGVMAVVGGHRVFLGNEMLMKENAVSVTQPNTDGPGTILYIAVDGRFAGCSKLPMSYDRLRGMPFGNSSPAAFVASSC